MHQNQTIKSVLAKAIAQLHTNEAVIDAQLLFQHTLNVNRAWLIAHENDELESSICMGFQALIERRQRGEPTAYILGHRDFYGLQLKVTPDTLIPRPDTETLVDFALAKTPQNQSKQILDLGTGSGAIGLAIAHNRPKVKVTATDTSMKALYVAKENAKNLSIQNIRFVESDWYMELGGETFDVIVSNPPYIEENDHHLLLGDLRYEPLIALASGVDGLNDIKQIIDLAPQHLNPNGCLLLEHGYNQAQKVAALMKATGFNEVETVKDLGGNQRVTLGIV
jgi:release factor glutamine methyltransferase